jgi:hypothetical protein
MVYKIIKNEKLKHPARKSHLLDGLLVLLLPALEGLVHPLESNLLISISQIQRELLCRVLIWLFTLFCCQNLRKISTIIRYIFVCGFWINFCPQFCDKNFCAISLSEREIRRIDIWRLSYQKLQIFVTYHYYKVYLIGQVFKIIWVKLFEGYSKKDQLRLLSYL